MYETVTLERKDGYAILVLDRPAVLNAISPQLAHDVVAALARLATDSAIRAVIVTGAGRGFCSGLDTRVLTSGGTGDFDLHAPQYNIPTAFASFAGPVVAAVNGIAFTGGFEIVLACDVIVAGESARFVDGHSRIGLLPGWGMASRLQRLIGEQRARYVHFSGRPVPGRQAEQWGLASLCVPDAELLETTEALVRDMVAGAPDILAPIKRLVQATGRGTLEDGLALEAREAKTRNAARGTALTLGNSPRR